MNRIRSASSVYLNIVDIAVVLKTVAENNCQRGMMKIINNSGPRTEPCGTPCLRGTEGHL